MTTSNSQPRPNNKKRRTPKNPETALLLDLNSCSKTQDLTTAISLYESAVTENTNLNQNHFNILLYLCSTAAAAADPSSKSLAFDYAYRIFEKMTSSGTKLNEATITPMARVAAAKGDGDHAFKLVKDMVEGGTLPRLRTYVPALLYFCEKLDTHKAYEVEEHMVKAGISLEEPEITALLRLSAETGNKDKVYRYLHILRDSVGCVRLETAEVIESWFSGEKGNAVVGGDNDLGLIKDAVLKNGGGWHGLGWVGAGKWVVQRGNVEPSGRCCCCSEKLACVDIDDADTEKFASSMATLALEREAKSNFSEFQDWLEKHSDYEAIVDGANIGLYQQNFVDGGFSVTQLDRVVKELYTRNGNKWPLVVLHKKRVRMLNTSHGELVKEWIDNGVLYTTPPGSNDDWYWLYAAVKLRCLLVTNDEMRDHIFELLGSSFFLKWKERHQVHYTFEKGSLKLQMPPPYSLVIQESEKGSWHVPVISGSSENSSQTWLCITRPQINLKTSEYPINNESSKFGKQNPTLTNKRKEMSSPPSDQQL